MTSRPHNPNPTERVRQVAVVDIGATAIRMEIAEIQPGQPPRTLEQLSQPVRLGREAFTTGMIGQGAIEECVRILREYRQRMEEYGIRSPDQIRAIATSAIREAANRDAILDRIYVATGLNVECAEDADLVRLTYLAVRHLPWKRPPDPALVVEVGGGSTEVLLMRGGRVEFYETYPLGALRLREMLEAGRIPVDQQRRTMERNIRRVVETIRSAIPPVRVRGLIAISGDARFAAQQLCPQWDRLQIASLAVPALAQFTHRLADQTPDELVARHGLSFIEAETLGPSLLTYVILAQTFGVRRVYVPKVHLRTAMELEMSLRPELAEEFRDRIREAADMLAERYRADRAHAEQVTRLALRLFDALGPLHGLGPHHRFLLEIAARLHEIGLFVSNRSHHKHSMYLIQNSELFGVRRHDLLVVALVARYHRKAVPDPAHPGYCDLPRESRIVVQKLAALLRVADALDRAHQRRVRLLDIEWDDQRLRLKVSGVDDLTIERMALTDKGRMFEDLFGLKIELVRAAPIRGVDDHA